MLYSIFWLEIKIYSKLRIANKYNNIFIKKRMQKFIKLKELLCLIEDINFILYITLLSWSKRKNLWTIKINSFKFLNWKFIKKVIIK